MKKRRPLSLEPLESREMLDASLGLSAAGALPSLAQKQAVFSDPPLLAQPSPAPLAPDNLANVPSAKVAKFLSEFGLAGDTEALDNHALEALFADSDELARLFTTPSQAPSEQNTSIRPTASPQTETEGWHFLHNYSRKAIRNEEHRHGPLPDREDLVHQIFVEWREQVGSDGQSLTHLLNKDSPERFVLRKAARRVLDHARYVRDRDSQIQELIDQPAPTLASDEDWRDLQIDLTQGVGSIDARERQLLDLRRQGMTFDEIGDQVGLAKQRVCEVFSGMIERLQAIYC